MCDLRGSASVDPMLCYYGRLWLSVAICVSTGLGKVTKSDTIAIAGAGDGDGNGDCDSDGGGSESGNRVGIGRSVLSASRISSSESRPPTHIYTLYFSRRPVK